MPDYGTPGILTGAMPWEANSGDITAWFPADEMERMVSLGGGKRTAIKMTVSGRSFGRMLAKIAHSYAVALVGNGAFKPFLLDLILNDHNRINYYIGNEKQNGPISQEPDFFSLGLHSMKLPNGKDALYVKIRLFSWLLTPVYVAIVGESMSNKLSFVENPNYHKKIELPYVLGKGGPFDITRAN